MSRKEQLDKLRGWMKAQDLDAYIVPMADAFLSEYVPSHAMRLAWLTGFDGSAGTAVITQDKAVLFTDGRYMIQAHQQLDTQLYDVINIAQTKLASWLKEEVEQGTVGYDPMLHSAAWFEVMESQGFTLKQVADNPIDDWWDNRPEASTKPAVEYAIEYAGQTSTQKREIITKQLKAQKADALLISAAENIAWLLNIRGYDLECTPVVQAYALLHADGAVQLFVSKNKIPSELEKKLQPIDLYELDDFGEALAKLSGKTLLIHKDSTPALFANQAEQSGAIVMFADDPIARTKAIKNDAELKGMRNVHVTDGAALVKSLAQIDAWIETGEKVDELKIDALLNSNRSMSDGFISLSFPAIVGSGEHGAIVHYRVIEETNRTLKSGELLLIDSGGQYLGGTTDVTRTLPVGVPNKDMCRHYTLVLKGHIALGSAVFPKGTTGSQLDVLARKYLWAEGLDYDHGTGHGVGACLNVHEGPQGISKRANSVVLEPGMILSNEPGYYPEGKYGIRIENLVEVVEKQAGFYGFENLTFVPYARALIDVSMLSVEEQGYINKYHQQVLEQISPHLNEAEQHWLKVHCQPL